MSWRDFFTFKQTTVPETNETKEIETVQLWYVRWNARTGSYSSDTKPVMEAFTSKQEALDFAESLNKAKKLLQYSASETNIYVEQN